MVESTNKLLSKNMKIYPSFNGRVENGKLIIENRQKLDEYVSTLTGEVLILIKKKRKIRSLSANSYYWVCINLAADELGYNPDELHNSFKAMFLTDKTLKIPLVRSTTKLNSHDFGLYLDKVLRKLTELEIVIPTPKEFYGIDYLDFK